MASYEVIKEISSLFTEDDPLIDEVVQLEAVPRLVEFLKKHDYPQLRFLASLFSIPIF